MAYLALIRHGESEWNARDIWTGWTDIPLSPKGEEEAQQVAQQLKSIHWDIVFESALIRAKQTTDIILSALGYTVPRIFNNALDERNYGVYTGKNKLEVEKELGADEYLKLRRGWDRPIKDGESLKDVYNRVVPYYEKEILPRLKEGKNVIVSAHGNSLRALMKYLDKMTNDQIENYEIPTGGLVLRELTF